MGARSSRGLLNSTLQRKESMPLPLLLALLLGSHVSFANKYSKEANVKGSCTGSHCHRTADEGPCIDDGKEKLYRWDPVKVGHVRELKLDGKKKYKMITKAIYPPVFEIPDFLTSKESDHIVNLAKKAGMHESDLHWDSITTGHMKLIRSTEGHSNSTAGYFLNWDIDRDFLITREEIKVFAERVKYIILEDKDIDEMIENLNITELADGTIDYVEWQNLRTNAIDIYLNNLKDHHPHHRDRFSKQVWLHQGIKADKVMKRLRRRIWKLTRLPKYIVYGGEPLQVVGYDERGHYNAHYDGTRKTDFPNDKCCHFDLINVPHCRLCRYITVLYYLSDVEEGGETAFPVADVANFNETAFRDRKDGNRYNLGKYCHSAKLVVPPKKGKAIMWYNYLRDDKTGWMGPREERSLHGGCDVIKGHKYIANNWLTAPEPDSAHLKSNYLSEKELKSVKD